MHEEIVGAHEGARTNVQKIAINKIRHCKRTMNGRVVECVNNIGKRNYEETPFSLVYGSEAVISLELIVLIDRTTNYDQIAIKNGFKMNLELSMERWEITTIW
uniref:Uncharacterized protein n=1 Tax=Lactuca sativa TaxID=4236 RepID=A0A9R1VYF5_LACSA|nr:hypothetical protein LSAT_V11C400191670 [Lactuca sativa]